MQQSVIFLSFKGCGPGRTPYNAPPSTRNNGKQAAGSAGKSVKLSLDSERGKRNIRHLATVSESRVALLFNNLSDNLCGHSK
ncbi:hypothetical protein C6560_23325 [Enterobacter sp. FS01]|nr:hypothetical protein C6560_23325 [Enterobacter sp. FS01]